jgi:hypothetical protein
VTGENIMAWIAGAVAIGGSLLNNKIAANRAGTPVTDKDIRTTEAAQQLEQALGRTLSAEERSTLQDVLSQQSSTGTEDTTGTEAATGAEATRTTDEAAQVSSGTETGTVTRGSSGAEASLESIISGGSAIDGGAAIDAAIQRVLESGAPAIANAGNRAGSFDSTVTAQLQNDLVSQAARAGAEVDIQQQNQNLDRVLQAIDASQAGSEVSSVISSGEQETTGASTGQTDTSQQTLTDQQVANSQQTASAQQTQSAEIANTEASQQQANLANTISDSFSDVETSPGRGDINRPLIASTLGQQIVGEGNQLSLPTPNPDGSIPIAPVSNVGAGDQFLPQPSPVPSPSPTPGGGATVGGGAVLGEGSGAILNPEELAALNETGRFAFPQFRGDDVIDAQNLERLRQAALETDGFLTDGGAGQVPDGGAGQIPTGNSGGQSLQPTLAATSSRSNTQLVGPGNVPTLGKVLQPTSTGDDLSRILAVEDPEEFIGL